MSFQDQMNAVQNRMRVKVVKPADQLDDRLSLCGEPVQTDEDGNQYFVIPAHQAEYQMKLHPHYIFGEPYIEEEKRGPGRPRKGEE